MTLVVAATRVWMVNHSFSAYALPRPKHCTRKRRCGRALRLATEMNMRVAEVVCITFSGRMLYLQYLYLYSSHCSWTSSKIIVLHASEAINCVRILICRLKSWRAGNARRRKSGLETIYGRCSFWKLDPTTEWLFWKQRGNFLNPASSRPHPYQSFINARAVGLRRKEERMDLEEGKRFSMHQLQSPGTSL